MSAGGDRSENRTRDVGGGWCVSSSPPDVIIYEQCGRVRKRIRLLLIHLLILQGSYTLPFTFLSGNTYTEKETFSGITLDAPAFTFNAVTRRYI